MAIEFYREWDEPYGGFSNFSRHGFQVDGMPRQTAEHYFQAMKFAQHTELRALLLGTGDEDIIEAAYNDAYWGWGPDKGGKNMLGKVLMEVRAELRTHGELQQGRSSE